MLYIFDILAYSRISSQLPLYLRRSLYILVDLLGYFLSLLVGVYDVEIVQLQHEEASNEKPHQQHGTYDSYDEIFCQV